MGYFEEKENKNKRKVNLTQFMIGYIFGALTLLGTLALGRFLYGTPDCIINGIC